VPCGAALIDIDPAGAGGRRADAAASQPSTLPG